MMKSILEIDKDINNWYRSSKLPKNIKIFICKRKRRKLKKEIHKFSNKIYSTKDIIQFLYYAMGHGAASSGLIYLKSCKYNDEEKFDIIYANFEYIDNNSKNEYKFDVDVLCKTLKMNIDIQITSERGVSRFHISNLDSLSFKEKDTEIKEYLISALNSMIGEMMETLMNDILNRSERIYEI